MARHELICFSKTVSSARPSLQVEVGQGGRDLVLRYQLTADLAQLLIPEPQPSAAIDGLWRHTCFEVFIAPAGDTHYREFNFSPSGQWAAYAFSAYRIVRPWQVSEAPVIRREQNAGRLLLEARIAAADLPSSEAGASLQLGLTAVLEAVDGGLSYWALRHPADCPDFHHRGGFTCILSAGNFQTSERL